MALIRPQTIVTKSVNDVIAPLGDGARYQNVSYETFMIGGVDWYRCSFTDAKYDESIQKNNVVSYLSAYMLGYSKMLMQSCFQYIVQIGGIPLYSDTDSVVMQLTADQRRLFCERWVPPIKTFGGMVIEEEGKRNTTIGPKKYALSQVNGDYSWHANGLRARCNIDEDILAKFVSVLKGNVEAVSWWAILSGANFGLYHSEEGVTKKMRFICLKGPWKEAIRRERMVICGFDGGRMRRSSSSMPVGFGR